MKADASIVQPLVQAPTGRRRALVIDDSDKSLKIYRQILTAQGYIVEEVARPAELNGYLQHDRHHYALAVVDYLLWEGTTGISVAKELLRRRLADRIVIVTAYPGQINQQEMAELGIPVFQKDVTPVSEILRELELGQFVQNTPVARVDLSPSITGVGPPENELVGDVTRITPAPIVTMGVRDDWLKVFGPLARLVCTAFVIGALLGMILWFMQGVEANNFSIKTVGITIFSFAVILFGVTGVRHPGPLAEQFHRAWDFLSDLPGFHKSKRRGPRK